MAPLIYRITKWLFHFYVSSETWEKKGPDQSQTSDIGPVKASHAATQLISPNLANVFHRRQRHSTSPARFKEAASPFQSPTDCFAVLRTQTLDSAQRCHEINCVPKERERESAYACHFLSVVCLRTSR